MLVHGGWDVFPSKRSTYYGAVMIKNVDVKLLDEWFKPNQSPDLFYFILIGVS